MFLNVVRWAIWYHLYNLKNVKNIHGRELLLVLLLLEKVLLSTKINTHPWSLFTFFKLYKWYQIAQSIMVICGSVARTPAYI